MDIDNTNSQPSEAEIIAILKDIDPLFRSLLSDESSEEPFAPQDGVSFLLSQLDLLDDPLWHSTTGARRSP
ncbi:MAG: hypothetical protein AAF633_14220 [Chloroflexota bacterium]